MRSLLALLLAATLLACGDEERRSVSSGRSSDSAGAYYAFQSRHRIGYDANGNPSAVALSEIVVTGASDGLPPITPVDVTASMMIRTADVSIEVDSLEPAIARVRQLATQVGGYLASTDITTGGSQLRKATLEVKVPAQRFDESLSGLNPIGKLETVSVNAEDVGEQFVDATARMENSRRLERRLIDLLATRTGKLKDVLDVEQALARVREEIERAEGRMRYLRAHTAMSTLSVTVHEPLPVVGTAGQSVMGNAFRQAWRNFVVLISLAVQSLGVILPIGIVAVAGWMVTRRWRMAKQRTA